MSELTMSKSDREAFLSELHVGILAVERETSAPLAAPVWYSYEPGGDVVMVLESTSEKLALIGATGHASLCVQTEVMPYRYVTVEGPVVVGGVDDEAETSLAYKYLGPEIGDIYLAAVAESESRVVRLTPTRWRTVDYGPFVERVLNEAASG